MTQPTSEALAPTREQTGDTAPPICDHCDKPAVFAYNWDWGEAGVCCAEHQVVLGQKSKTLKRGCQFTAIASAASPPVQREERVRLIAEKLAAEAELGDSQQRALSLLRSNEHLASQVNMFSARSEAQKARIAELEAAALTHEEEIDARDRELGKLADEVSRLRLLAGAAGALDEAGTLPGAGEG